MAAGHKNTRLSSSCLSAATTRTHLYMQCFVRPFSDVSGLRSSDPIASSHSLSSIPEELQVHFA